MNITSNIPDYYQLARHSNIVLSFQIFDGILPSPDDVRFGSFLSLRREDGHKEFIHYTNYDIDVENGLLILKDPERYKGLVVDFEYHRFGLTS